MKKDKIKSIPKRWCLVVGALLFCFQATTAMATVTFVPSDLNIGDEYHVAFLTSTGVTAVSSDIAVYNSFVQTAAEQIGADTENWGVSWFAVASTLTVDANANVPVTTAPIYLLTDVRVADNASDLWDGTIQAPISINQFGVGESNTDVWTGTQSDGTAFAGAQLGTSDPRVGFSGIGDAKWVSFGTDTDTTFLPVYAISEKLTVVPEPGTGLLLAVGGIAVALRRRRLR